MPPASVWAQPSARTPFAVPITLAAPQKLQVGEMNDLIVSVGPNGDVGEVSFKLLFDPNILQVRIGTEGDWGAGAGADARSFAAEISDEGDRAQVRRSVSDLRAGVTGGGVAILRFQAVAAGSTEVLMTDVVVKDLAGRSIASAVSAPRLHVTVDAAPPRQPDAGRRFQGVEPNAETRGQGD